MSLIIRHLKQIFVDFIWIFTNGLVNKIPIAFIRKLLYKTVGLRIGRGSRIGIGTIVIQPWKIAIGENTVINEFCYLDGRGELEIGNNVSISIYSRILTASHNVDDNLFMRYKKKVIICDQVWIGLAAVVLEGSYLSMGSVIGANAVFKGNTEEKGIYLGNPAIFKRYRKIETIEIKDLSYFK